MKDDIKMDESENKVNIRPFAYAISLMPVLEALCHWGHEHVPDDWEL